MKLFTSDLHFGHTNICRYTNRSKETSQQEHDTWLTDLWNSSVKAGDLVYVLGDVHFSSRYNEVADRLSKLNGQKIFIKGNHDRSEHFDELLKDNLIVKWSSYEEIKVGGTKACLFHFPIASWHQQSRGSMHLHGHSHGNFKDSKGKMLDVGIDNYFNIFGKHGLFSEQDVVDYMNQQETYVSDLHRSSN